ncbi:hypothetical protein BH11ARM2_BH11ARM2_26450 [soil metagenome]
MQRTLSTIGEKTAAREVFRKPQEIAGAGEPGSIRSVLGSAYTPGLTVSPDIVVRRTRRLQIRGEVLVSTGDLVGPDQVVARALLPGVLQTIKLAERLGVEAKDAPEAFRLKSGDPVEKGQTVAETKGFMGFFRSTVESDYTGTIETISEVTGNVLVREPGIPVDVDAYVQGTVAEVLPGEGIIVETRAAMIQGIFGVGGERRGRIRVAVASPDSPLTAADIKESDKGAFLVGGSGIEYDAILRAVEVGACGIVAGGVRDSDLVKYLGYDIGVAITGTEKIPITIMVTEGFGFLGMAGRTFDLLKSLEGQEGSINGATQIRAGVIRPEILIPIAVGSASLGLAAQVFELGPGSPIRIIREPYFGRLGTVTELPATLQTLESGTEVRVLRARLNDGEEVTVPRANVEILAA